MNCSFAHACIASRRSIMSKNSTIVLEWNVKITNSINCENSLTYDDKMHTFFPCFCGISILHCPFASFIFVLCTMLPVFLKCQFLIAPSFRLSSSCVPYVASFSGFSIFDCPFVLFIFVLCSLCCQLFWSVHFWLSLRFVYLHLVANFSGVSIFFIAPSVFSNVYLCATEKHMYFVHIVKCWLYVISAHTLIL